jgi:glycosyltransferase involved in cell wall biosynthesis
MIVENSFPNDIRVRKEAEALKGSYGVSVIALNRRGGQKFYEIVNGIEVFRLPRLRLPGSSTKINYMLQYLYFTALSTAVFLLTFIKRRYRVVHAHNPPDTLFVVGLAAKLLSVKFVFDHHDLSPELYLTRISGKKGLVYRTLVMCEKMSCKVADAVICTNGSYREIEINRHNIDRDKISIVRNNPAVGDCLLTARNGIAGKDHRKGLLFLGSINPQDGVDILLRALHHIALDEGRRDFVCYIIGDGDSLEAARRMAHDLGLTDYVDFKGPIFDRNRIKEYLNLCDIGLEPAPDNELNRHSTFIKVMEYMAAGRPVVAFDLKETRFSTGEAAALLVAPNDVTAYAKAIVRLMDDRDLRGRMGEAGRLRIHNELNWPAASENLLKAYGHLCTGTPS